MARQVKPAVKFVGIFVIVAVILGGLYLLKRTFGDSLSSTDSNSSSSTTGGGLSRIFGGGKTGAVNVCVNTWGGYAGGLYMNNGMSPNDDSRFAKDFHVKVNMILIDDFTKSRDAWKNGQCDLLWITADSFPTEADSLMSFKPKIVFQFDWSRGGDVAVGTRNVRTVADLKGKRIAFADGTPSETLLNALLEAGNLSYNDVVLVKTKSAPDAAKAFQTGNADAAIMWSPDDIESLKQVPGSHVLKSTREASNLIADVFYVKQEFLSAHQEELTNLAKGWLTGNAEVNSDSKAFAKAAELTTAFNVSKDDAEGMIKNVRLATYGDNMNFFGLNVSYTGITGKDLYTKMGQNYVAGGVITAYPDWRSVTDITIVRNLGMAQNGNQAAETGVAFTPPTEAVIKAPEFSSKPVTVNFASNSAILDENAKYAIDSQFLDIAKKWRDNRIRIEGNTDSQGNAAQNKALSERRAQAVVDYLVQKGFNKNRFAVLGNGPTKPVADNSTEDGRAKNRRTEFQLLSDAQ